MKLSHRVLIIVISSLFVLSVSLSLFLYLDFRNEIVLNAEERAKILLNRNIATHQYFNQELKPAVFSLAGEELPEDYFDPVWMSSTYAIREIDRIFKSLTDRNYIYKEAAIDARTPANEADTVEREFIIRLNENDDLMRKTATREIDGESYFQVLRRGETMESSCLRCHSTPEAASQQMVERYGPERSFYRTEGEVVSAISILVPLDYLFSRYGNRLVRMILVLAGLSLLIGIVTVVLNKRYITGPLEEIRDRAFDAARNPGYVVTGIDLKYSSEINDLASSINSLSGELNHHINNLDALVKERTDRLEKLLSEKDFLMKELNHRVKNNLLMVSSLIGLKDAALGEKADLSDLMNRINTVRIVHEKLYQSEDLTEVDFPEYVDELLAGAFAVASTEISVEKEIEIESLHQKIIVPLGLIINELAMNTVKHNAEREKPITFSIRAFEETPAGNYVVVVANSGNPFPPDIDFENPESLGLRLISALIDQIEGTIELQRSPHPVFTIRFPAP